MAVAGVASGSSAVPNQMETPSTVSLLLESPALKTLVLPSSSVTQVLPPSSETWYVAAVAPPEQSPPLVNLTRSSLLELPEK